MSRSLYQKDKRIFTFILCLDLMIYKQQLETKDVEILMTKVPSHLFLSRYDFTWQMTTQSIILPICQFQIRIKLKAKEDSESPNPTSWLSNEAWAQICSLQQLEAFKVKKEIKDVASI